MTDQTPSMCFSGNPLDRAGNFRGDPAWLAEKYQSDDALFIPLWQLQPLLLPPIAAGDSRDVGWLPRSALASLLTPDRLCIFLGLNRRDKPLFAIDISEMADPENSGPLANMGVFEDLRMIAGAGDIGVGDLAILAQAKAMLDWHSRHGFCSQCGNATQISEAGYKRVCPACQTEHFPRTDPVVIMLATHGDDCLVGRQHGWPENMFSALAGFVEAGETIEEAVAREMMEEAGIEVGEVRYMATQPWPFPASLMIGCFAEAKNRDIKLDDKELEDARWVSRDEIRSSFAGDGPIGIPPSMAIAHHLVRQFAGIDDE
jgi:NAD+ diphosphatase